jgi:molybdopterin synthase catalytic subunit
MMVRVMLFASHREVMGSGRLELEVPSGCTVGDLFDVLVAQQPAMGALHDFTLFAVNREIVPPTTRLQPGDEVALVQPVSGGVR